MDDKSAYLVGAGLASLGRRRDAPGNEEQRRLARFLKDNRIDKGNSASAPAKDSTAISQPARNQITLSLACPPNEY